MSIQLFAFDTPNGRKISVALEEMGLAYQVQVVNITKDDQYKPDFLSISPNNKIPAIIDTEGPDGKPISVFESGAILIYLAEKTGQFLPAKGATRVAALEWLMFQMGGFGPMPGQVHHFAGLTNADDKRYGLQRYMTETETLWGDGQAFGRSRVFRWRLVDCRLCHPGMGLAPSAPPSRFGRFPPCQALV